MVPTCDYSYICFINNYSQFHKDDLILKLVTNIIYSHYLYIKLLNKIEKNA